MYRALGAQGIEKGGVNTKLFSDFYSRLKSPIVVLLAFSARIEFIFPYVAICASCIPYVCIFFGGIMTLGVGLGALSS